MIPQHDIAEQRQRLPGTAVALLGVWAVACSSLCAQERTIEAQRKPVPEVRFTVREAARTGQLINVPVNKGLLVDFNVPVREVRMANPDIADVASTGPRQILVSGKSFGTTQLVVWVDGGEQTVFDVAVDIELERLHASIRAAFPRARVKVNSVLDTVVLTGTVPDTEAAQKIAEIAGIYSPNVVNHARVVGVQQVLLRCTVAEVNKSATRQLGFNGWMAGDDFKDVFFVNQLDGINPVNIGGAADFGPITRTIPFVTDRQEGLPLRAASTLSVGFPRVQMQVFIQALRENGLLRILAEPNLVTINGQEASFLAGGELPIPLATDERIKIEYKEFGVRLRFTPTVLSENVIRLHVAPELSEPDLANSVTFGGISIPAFASRRVETVVELGPGQTFAIGGLLSERVRAVSRKVPALGDVPILGALFRSVEYQSDETELVVLVTPELVAPLSPDQITYVPGAELVAPNDFELFGEGRLEGRRGASARGGRPAHVWPVRPVELYGPELCKLRGPVGPAGADEGG